MNDEFLYRLRIDPPPAFAARLKRRLASGGSAPRARSIRVFIAVSLLGASAFAVMSPSVRDRASDLVQVLRGRDDGADQAKNPATAPSPAVATAGSSAHQAPTRSYQREPITRQRTASSARPPSSGASASHQPASTAVPSGATAGNVLGGRVPEKIRLTGSPIVYPFSRAVAQQYDGGSARISVEALADSSEGFVRLCEDPNRPVVLQAARRMNQAEYQACRSRSVSPLYEARIGHYAKVLVSGAGAVPMSLTRRHLYFALARQVPNPHSPRRALANPNRTWQDVDVALPALKIEILGPPLVLETGDAFAELFLGSWCDADPHIRTLVRTGPNMKEQLCQKVRNDEGYLAMTGEESAWLARLDANPNALAFVDYGFLSMHRDRLVEVPFEEMKATRESIASGAYPGARTLYLYTTNLSSRLQRTLRDFVDFYVSERTIGPQGSLVSLGLIPLTVAERATVRQELLVEISNR